MFPIDVRRAVLQTLLAAGRPLRLAEILERLPDGHGLDNKSLSDLLRHQVHRGRVVRTGRGMYGIRTSGIAATTLWRIRTWRPRST